MTDLLRRLSIYEDWQKNQGASLRQYCSNSPDMPELAEMHEETADVLKEARAEIERLRAEKREAAMQSLVDLGQLEMHLEEIQRLKDKCDKQAMILRRLNPENFPDTYFICGEMGEKDQNGMPKKILVAPAYGVDFAYEYEYNDKVTGPEW